MTAVSQNSQIQFKKMTETPVPKLIASLAVPTVISMLVSSIYNMADTFFVSKLGTSAAGAVGIVFSLMAVIQAVVLDWEWVPEAIFQDFWDSREIPKLTPLLQQDFFLLLHSVLFLLFST